MQFVEVCPVVPQNGVCPEPLVWVHMSTPSGLSLDEFLDLAPTLWVTLVICFGVNLIVRKFFIYNK